MKTIEQQMKIADEVMAKLETFDPTCILAGGAPRDWLFGNLATDLDFFVYWRPEFVAQKFRYLTQLSKLKFTPREKIATDLPQNYKRNPYLIAVYEFEYKGETVQVMFMSEPTFTSVVPLFPFGICQAWYKTPLNPQDPFSAQWGCGIQVTELFKESVRHKVLRLVNDLYNDTDGYIEKIRSKFPDYLFLD